MQRTGNTQISGHSSIDPKAHVERIYRGMPSPLIWATHAFTRSSDMSGWLSSSHGRPARAIAPHQHSDTTGGPPEPEPPRKLGYGAPTNLSPSTDLDSMWS